MDSFESIIEQHLSWQRRPVTDDLCLLASFEKLEEFVGGFVVQLYELGDEFAPALLSSELGDNLMAGMTWIEERDVGGHLDFVALRVWTRCRDRISSLKNGEMKATKGEMAATFLDLVWLRHRVLELLKADPMSPTWPFDGRASSVIACQALGFEKAPSIDQLNGYISDSMQ
ncbi:MAG: hypothetical protein PF961_07085 [Planctomycetota bacterium]|jgi:hypothetical protein|nr:hypothetical protein [Planctomycetota bacterium]